MNCPRCEGTLLQERNREGVIVDVCEGCRGLWLDRGELEKLTARAMREHDELERWRDDDRPRRYRYRDDDDERGYRDPRRKRRWFESLGEIFD